MICESARHVKGPASTLNSAEAYAGNANSQGARTPHCWRDPNATCRCALWQQDVSPRYGEPGYRSDCEEWLASCTASDPDGLSACTDDNCADCQSVPVKHQNPIPSANEMTAEPCPHCDGELHKHPDLAHHFICDDCGHVLYLSPGDGPADAPRVESCPTCGTVTDIHYGRHVHSGCEEGRIGESVSCSARVSQTGNTPDADNALLAGAEAAMAGRYFGSGAYRDADAGKIDFEGFLCPLVLEAFGAYMDKHRLQSDGVLRDSDNWQAGIPRDQYMKSAWRHFHDLWKEHRGYESRDGLDDAMGGLLFNLMGYWHETLKERQ